MGGVVRLQKRAAPVEGVTFRLKSQPVLISATTTTLSAATLPTNSSSPSSFFAKENLVLTYDRPGEQTEFRLLGVGRFTQFFDVGTDDKDISVTASFTHNFTTRLSFNAEIYARLPDGA